MAGFVGWVGVGLLMLAYLLLNSKYSKWFIPVDTIASLILTVHAIILRDIPFIVVNGFVSTMLIIKWIKKGYTRL